MIKELLLVLLTAFPFYSLGLQQELERLEKSLHALQTHLENNTEGLLGPKLLQVHPTFLRAYDTTENWYQINVLKQQEWQTCGFHAIKNSLYLLRALNHPITLFSTTYAELQKQEVFTELFSVWSKFNPEATKLGLFPLEIDELVKAISNKKYTSNNLEKYAQDISVLSQLGKSLTMYPEHEIYDLKNLIKHQEEITDEKKLNILILIIEILKGMTPQEIIPLIRYLRDLQTTPSSLTHHAFIIGNEHHWVTVVAHVLGDNKEFLIADSLGASVENTFKQQLNNFFLLQTFPANVLAWYYLDYVYLIKGLELFASNEIFPLFLQTMTKLQLQNTPLYLAKYKERIKALIDIAQEWLPAIQEDDKIKAQSITNNVQQLQLLLLS